VLGEAQLAEAMEMLRQIRTTRTKFLGETKRGGGGERERERERERARARE
jgi:hypothetical protein